MIFEDMTRWTWVRRNRLGGDEDRAPDRPASLRFRTPRVGMMAGFRCARLFRRVELVFVMVPMASGL